MGAVFAFAAGTGDIKTAHSGAVATGMRITFLTAAILILIALVVAVGSRALTSHKRPQVGSPIGDAPQQDPTAGGQKLPAGSRSSWTAAASSGQEPR
jgi:hypothetical protein